MSLRLDEIASRAVVGDPLLKRNDVGHFEGSHAKTIQ